MNKVNSLENYLADGRNNVPDSVKKSYRDQIESIKMKIDKIKDEAVESNSNKTRSGDDELFDSSSNNSSDIEDSSDIELKSLEHVEDHIRSSSSEGSEKRRVSLQSASSNDTCSNKEANPKRKRYNTSYDFKTGWVANCSTCGKVGKYRHPTQGRVFQHSSGTGKYCGYYRDNPRREEEALGLIDQKGKTNNVSHYTSAGPLYPKNSSAIAVSSRGVFRSPAETDMTSDNSECQVKDESEA
jgi:hypothetical protein